MHLVSFIIRTQQHFAIHLRDVSEARSVTVIIKSILLFISVINQLDAQNVCFTISLFHASTCFEHHV